MTEPFDASLAMTLLWCVLQVTLFAFLASVFYLSAKRLSASLAPALLSGSLLLILLLTMLAGSPWPRWGWDARETPLVATGANAAPASATISAAESQNAVDNLEKLSPYREAWQAFAETIAAPSTGAADAPGGKRSSLAIMGWLALVGLLASGARLVWGIWQVHGLLRDSTRVEDERPREIIAKFCNQLGSKGAVALRQSAKIVTPATVGWRRQSILLPLAWREWTEEELHAVLAHELSHVASRDYRAWLLARLTVAIHFYHPLVRWLASRLQLEQELAADATAARLLGDRGRYLRCLASLALATPPHRLAGPARTLIPSRSLLMRRVEMLRTTAASKHIRPVDRHLRLSGVGLLVLLAIAIAGVRGPAVSVAEEPGGVLTEVLAAQEVERIPLKYVPVSAVFALSLRPAGLLTDQELVKELDQFEGLSVLQQTGLSWKDVAEVMIVLPGMKHAPPRWIIRFNSPEACLVYANHWMQRAGSVKVFDNAQRWRNHSEQGTRLDPSTLAFEEYANVEARGGELPPHETDEVHPWAEEWGKQNASPLAVAVNVAPTRPFFQQELQEAVERGGGLPLQTIAPLIDYAEWAVAAASLGEKFQLSVVAQCDSAKHAEQITNIVQAMITLSGVAVEQQASVMQAELAKLPPEQADQMRPLGEKAMALAREFVTGAKPVTNGDRVELAFDSDELNVTSTATAARLLMPAVIAARHAARRTQSTNDLRQLSLAMLTYENDHGQYPPAVLFKEGSPHPYSWRVALLPYLEQQALYNQYRFDEPWDSEANKKIAETIVPVFQSPFDQPGSTNASYFVLTGPDTAFNGKEGTKLRTITDGTSRTWMIVEAKRDIPWTKPEDIPYATDKPLPELGGWMENLFVAAFCDGSVQAFPQDIDETTLRSMITKAGGEQFEMP